ncbi:hypothetical protein SH591_14005 [Sphingomonas sp. LY54]|uniref:hypothetical protein n=1 Tax=Sphingomonas sp. LY54 TaxID=3095343 RepID=UPI002D76AC8F|nr:hypothetical protein [Sphingomonas sp. LY54]WRP28201.1 hypothetical protein SH591_14005 [Sphingomonas sp. LY54]
MRLKAGIGDHAVIHRSLPVACPARLEGDAREHARRAEEELVRAEQATTEPVRKHHYFKAAILLNLAFGGDPRPGGETDVTY